MQLVKFIDEHYEPLAFDFLSFGLSIHQVGKSLSWFESRAFVKRLIERPGTETFAAVRKHEYAMSLEARISADLFDAHQSANTPKGKPRPKRYPRPWPDEDHTRSKPPTVSQATIRKALEERGHAKL